MDRNSHSYFRSGDHRIDTDKLASNVDSTWSEDASPAESVENAKTLETTTKAISTMATSSPVTPRWSMTVPCRASKYGGLRLPTPSLWQMDSQPSVILT